MLPPGESSGVAPTRGWPAAAAWRRFDRATLRRVTGRAALLWLLVRLAYTAMAGMAGQGVGGASLAARVLLVAVVVLLCAIDARASREPVFHANLGIGSRTTLGLSALVAGVLELLAGGLLGALRP